MTEPTTIAGRKFVFPLQGERRAIVERAIVAIEAEARSAALTALREWVEGLPEGKVRDHTTGRLYGTAQISRAAVLALIDRELGGTT